MWFFLYCILCFFYFLLYLLGWYRRYPPPVMYTVLYVYMYYPSIPCLLYYCLIITFIFSLLRAYLCVASCSFVHRFVLKLRAPTYFGLCGPLNFHIDNRRFVDYSYFVLRSSGPVPSLRSSQHNERVLE